MLVASVLVLLAAIAATVLYVEGDPRLLFVTAPLMIGAFFGVLQPLMWAMTRIGLPGPVVGVVPVPGEELQNALLGLGSDETPFGVERLDDGRVVCSWKIAEARWYEFFAKVSLREDYQLQLLLIEADKAVRAIEVSKRARRRVSLNRFEASWFGFRGWSIASVQKSKAWGVKDLFPLQIGKLYDIDFASRMFRAPVLELIYGAWLADPTLHAIVVPRHLTAAAGGPPRD